MKLLKKWMPELLVFPFLLVSFLFTRLTNIMSLPIFTDEAIYTRWAQIARFDSEWRFISLTDGKQPSFVWANIIMMKFIEDPLLAGRIVSVAAGFVTVIGLYFLSYELFSKSSGKRLIALITSALAVFFPFLIVYDRLAIYESLTAAFFIWALYFQIILVRRLRLDVAMILGFVLGGSVLTKSSGFLSIYMLPFLVILMEFGKKGLKRRILKFSVFSLVGIFIAYAMYSIQRLSPFFHIIEEKNSVFIYPVSEWMKFEFMDKIGNFIQNSNGLFNWFLIYFTIPYILLVIYSFIVKKEFFKEKMLLVIWFVVPLMGLAVFGKTLYPRYLLFMVLPLLSLVAYSIYYFYTKFQNVFLRALLTVFIVTVPLYQIYFIIFDFSRAPIPKLDLEQFINGWPAGGGVEESKNFFTAESTRGPIFVATQGTFGLMPASYEIYFQGKDNVEIKGYWPTNDQIPTEVLEKAQTIPTFFIFYQDCRSCDYPGDAPDTWPLVKISEYKKGIGDTTLSVYKVVPQDQ